MTSGPYLFVVHPSVERIVICEIEPLIPAHVGPLFHQQNHGVLDDPRVEVVYDDARHYILTTDEKFDIITSDPIHPWVRGAASLYTKEYFELVKSHLNPGGVVTQWVPQTALLDLNVRFAAMTQVGECITCQGEVTEKFEVAGERRVRLAISTRNEQGQVKLAGEAVVAVN